MKLSWVALLSVLVVCFFVGVVGMMSLGNAAERPRESYNPSPNLKTSLLNESSAQQRSGSLLGNELIGSVTPWPDPLLLETNLPANAVLSPAADLEYDQPVSCLPRVFGYTQLQAERLFPSNLTYPKCCSFPFSILSFSSGTRILDIICDEEEVPYIALGQKRREERLGGEKLLLDWRISPNGVNMEEREYAFGRCGNTLAEGVLVNNYNRTAAERANRTTEAIRSALNITAKHRPLSVYMIVFDSVSRQHFYRSFPQTTAFLNSTLRLSPNLSLYDFQLNNAAGINTAPNMIPFLFGHDLASHQHLIQNLSVSRPSDSPGFLKLQETAIWKVFERAGFVTMFGYDSVWDYLTRYLGREVAVDHMVSNFYRAAKQVFGYEDNMKKPRCFGCENAHTFLLRYITQFHANYRGLNRFAYIHLSPGHERSGTVIRTADADLKEFLEAITSAEEDLVLMVGSDHGRHVTPEEGYEATVENLLPAQMLIVSKELMRRMGKNTSITLSTNSKRLVSRYDWHLTLRHLSTLPYGLLQPSSALYASWQALSPAPQPLSLLLQTVPAARTCKDVAIPLYYCMCLDYQEGNPKEEMALEMAQMAVSRLNNETEAVFPLCLMLNLKNVTQVLVKNLQNQAYFYKIRFSVLENPAVLFDAIVLAASSSLFPLYSDPSDTHPTLQSRQGLLMQVRDIARVDEYSGVCEALAKAAGVPAPFCICQLPYQSPLSPAVLAPIQSVMLRITLVLAPKGIPCDKACSYASFTCIAWAFPLINSREILRFAQPIYRLSDKTRFSFLSLKAETISTKEAGVRLEEKEGNWTLALSDSPFQCEVKPPTAQLLCPCI